MSKLLACRQCGYFYDGICQGADVDPSPCNDMKAVRSIGEERALRALWEVSNDGM